MNQNRKHKRQKRKVVGGTWKLPSVQQVSYENWQEDEDIRLSDEGVPYNSRLKALILEVVENQLQADDPPEIKQTLNRLLAAGRGRQQAMEMIGSALVGEIWNIFHEQKPFDRERYVVLLEKLK
jgi:hypothetical protein